MATWFGKGCVYQCNKWEGDEAIDGPGYQDTKPILTFCNHEDNPRDTEGNCFETICPLNL